MMGKSLNYLNKIMVQSNCQFWDEYSFMMHKSLNCFLKFMVQSYCHLENNLIYFFYHYYFNQTNLIYFFYYFDHMSLLNEGFEITLK